MFGTPARDEEASDPGDLEEDCGEDPEEEAIEPEGEEPAEENFDPVEYADKLPPAGVAEICSSPEVAAEVAAASSSHETREAVDATDKKSQLQERLRELKQQMVLKRQETRVVPATLLDQAAEKLRAMPSSEVHES